MRVTVGYVFDIIGTVPHCARSVLDFSMDARTVLNLVKHWFSSMELRII